MARGGCRGRFLKNHMSTGTSSVEFEKKNLTIILSTHTYNGTWLKRVAQPFRDVQDPSSHYIS